MFAPHPLLTVTLEREGADREGVHFAAGGQGVWVARTAGELGAAPALCSFIGGESGDLLRGLLDRLPGNFREGCGDAMLGAIAATWSGGASFEQSLLTGAAAGAANFLRHGIGGAAREVIEELTELVTLEPVEAVTKEG